MLQATSYMEEHLELNRKRQLRLVINSLRQLQADMIYCKAHLTPYIEISPNKCSSEVNVCDNIDYSNPLHIKNALLLRPSEKISTDFNIVAYDMQKAVQALRCKGELTDYEMELLELYRSSVSNMTYVAKELNKHHKQVYRDLDKIIAKVIGELEK